MRQRAPGGYTWQMSNLFSTNIASIGERDAWALYAVRALVKTLLRYVIAQGFLEAVEEYTSIDVQQ